LGFLSISDIDFSEVCILFINDEIAAFMVCLSHDDEILVPRLAINSSYMQYSPGVLLIHYAIRDFLEDGSSISKLDLMQGEEKYKFQLGGKESKLYSFSLSNEKIL
jgi:CelD/BcsL family acetyltransferase involved in cellulose biosynthesis